jgi:hypothetical protein
MDFVFDNVRIPLAYTIWAKRELLKRFGDPQGIQAAFAVTDEVELSENMAAIGSIFAQAYSLRKKARCAITGESDDSMPISEETLFALLERDSTLALIEAISSTVAEGNKTMVETKTTEKKDEAMP